MLTCGTGKVTCDLRMMTCGISRVPLTKYGLELCRAPPSRPCRAVPV